MTDTSTKPKAQPFDLAELRTDPKKTLEGVWISPYKEIGSTFRLLLARHGNPKYLGYLMKELRRRSRGMNEEQQNKLAVIIEKEGMSKFVVLGWEDLILNGEPCVFSKAACFKFMTDVAYIDLFLLCQTLSQDMENFRESDQAAIVGN